MGDAVTKLQKFVWIFSHVSRVITWSLFNLRAPNLVKYPISTCPFVRWCQFMYSFKYDTRPSALCNSKMANSQGDGIAFATTRSSTWIVLNCILFVIVLDLCCVSIGDLTRDCRVFKGQTGLEFWVLRFRDLGALCFSLRFRVLRFQNYPWLQQVWNLDILNCIFP